MRTLPLEPYRAQAAAWPAEGRHVLACFDDDTVVVYQAYRPAIGHYAAAHGHFGGEFSLSRMSWIKPNFLWMMYRSGWGTKEGQEVVLAIWLARAAFDEIVAAAVAGSDVRLQWDPDHDPHGRPLARRAVQLGLRGDALRRYAREWVREIQDVSPLVAEHRAALARGGLDALATPRERVYPSR